MVFKKALLTLALSVMLSSGSGVFADHPDNGLTATQYKAALAVLIPLAEQGDVDAQLTLGIMYAKGLGVLENDRTAVKWYTLAAEQGHADAQYSLAVMFRDGKGVLENNKTAYSWAKLAAAQDHGDAQGLLGGLAVEDEDYLHAYKGYSLVIQNGTIVDNSGMKDPIKEILTPADVDMAQQMASRCLDSGYTDCGMIDKGAELTATVNYIKNEIMDNWILPANARNGMVVELIIDLVPTGEVVNVKVSYRAPIATDAFVSSVVRAVKKVKRFDKLSQLNAVLFNANFRQFSVKFKPEDLRL